MDSYIQQIAEQDNDTASAVLAGISLAVVEQKPQTVNNGAPFIIVNGKPVSLEDMGALPVRQKMNVILADAPSFIGFVNRYKREHSLIHCRTTSNGTTFTAEIDAPPNDPDARSWNERKVNYSPLHAEDFKTWHGVNKRWLDQEAFCELAEKQSHNFHVPNSADMLEIGRSIQAKTTGEFKSGVRLSNGDRELHWSNQTQASAGSGKEKFEIPETILLKLAIFQGDDLVPGGLSAFLRYRIIEGKVHFLIELRRVDEVLRAAVELTTCVIAEETGLPIFNAV